MFQEIGAERQFRAKGWTDAAEDCKRNPLQLALLLLTTGYRLQYRDMILSKVALQLAVAALVILVLTLWKVPQWQVGRVSRLSSKERFDRVNEARKTLATMLGGVLLLLGFFGTWQNIESLARSSSPCHNRGRSPTASPRPSSNSERRTPAESRSWRSVREEIYALERIANDSERDHWPIMEVLCTYVRGNAPRLPENAAKQMKNDEAGPRTPKPRADIQAILTVLGRRNVTYETNAQRLDLHDSDLQGAFFEGNFRRADLAGANVSGAYLAGVVLVEASLIQANLGGAKLYDANLFGAYLDRADLDQANLSSANLWAADLSGANLSGADLHAATLLDTKLSGANLRGADLGAAGFRDADLRSADLRGVDSTMYSVLPRRRLTALQETSALNYLLA